PGIAQGTSLRLHILHATINLGYHRSGRTAPGAFVMRSITPRRPTTPPDAAPIQPPHGLRRTPHRTGWGCGEGQPAAVMFGVIASTLAMAPAAMCSGAATGS